MAVLSVVLADGEPPPATDTIFTWGEVAARATFAPTVMAG